MKLIAISINSHNEESIINCYSEKSSVSTCGNCNHWRGSYSNKGHCSNTRSHAFYSGQFALSNEFCSEWEPSK